MALKVTVMSPLHQVGSSVVSAMLAQGITYSNHSATLLFNQEDSKLPNYIGIDDVSDPTRSVMQIVKLIDSGSIQDNDILDYTYNFATNVNLLNTADRTMSAKDKSQVINYVFKRTPTDVVILDNSDDLSTLTSTHLINDSDVIFVVVQMFPKAFERLKIWLDYASLKDKANVYVVFAEYNEVVFSIRDLARYIGLPASRVLKLHYNPWIAKCCINKQLHTILPLAMNKDPRVVNLRNDILEFNAVLTSEMLAASRKEI